MDFVRAHVPERSIVILTTPVADTDEYYRLSYALAGRNDVYWLTRGTPVRPPDWWTETDGSASDLVFQARRWKAGWVAFDALDPPAGLRLRQLIVFGPKRSLGQLGSV